MYDHPTPLHRSHCKYDGIHLCVILSGLVFLKVLRSNGRTPIQSKMVKRSPLPLRLPRHRNSLSFYLRVLGVRTWTLMGPREPKSSLLYEVFEPWV